MQNRLKSKALWIGIVSAMCLAYNAVADNFGLPAIGAGAAESIVNFIFGLIAIFSAVNNPTNKDNI